MCLLHITDLHGLHQEIVLGHVKVDGIQKIMCHVLVIQEILSHVHEVYQVMRHKNSDMEHLLRHGMEVHGLQLVYHGHMMDQNVDSHVIQTTHGIEIHVKQIVGQKYVDEVSQHMHKQQQQIHIHRHGMEAHGHQ